MGPNAKIGLAIGVGYLLGRQKRLRTALMLGGAAAAGRFSQNPGALLQRGGELLKSAPGLGEVTGLGKPLTTAGKAAAVAAVSRGIDSVGDRMHRRADSLRQRGKETEPEGTEPAEAAERAEAEEAEEAKAAESGDAEKADSDVTEARDKGETEEEEEEIEEEGTEGEEARAEEEESEDDGLEGAEARAEEEEAEEEEPEQRERPVSRSGTGRPSRTTRGDGDSGRKVSRRSAREPAEVGGAPVRRKGR